MKEKDADGRVPVSITEYEGLRTLFGVISMIPVVETKLQERVKSIPTAWRDLRLMGRLSEKLLDGLLVTVPARKLLSMRSELGRTRIIMTLNPSGDPMDYTVSEEAVVNLVKAACDVKCFGCTECRWWDCPTYKAVRDVLPYELPKCNGCPLVDGVGEREG